MEKKDFVGQERTCLARFVEAGNCFHVCSLEDHPVIFHNEDEYKAGMNIVAFVAFLFDDLKIFTFEIMSNHLHFAICGEEARIKLFLHMLKIKLAAHRLLRGAEDSIRTLDFRVLPIGNLENLRNVIAYINRNGFVVNQIYSPFSYPWGANRYFFNPDAKELFKSCGSKATYALKRELFNSNRLANEARVIVLDGYVSPASFCHIEEGESFFRSCSHYFYKVSRDVESAKDVAKTIGETLFYNDDELYSVAVSISAKKYGQLSLTTISKDQKIDLAKVLHYDYNATNKQVSRLLKISIDSVNLLFPKKSV